MPADTDVAAETTAIADADTDAIETKGSEMDMVLAHADAWIDVQGNLDEYKDFYDVPTKDAMDALAEKDTVKISNGFEKFFVRVSHVDGDIVYGVVENHLVGKYDYDFNDMVRFEKRNIFTIKKHVPRVMSAEQKNARRLIKMLGINPAEQTKEAMAIMAIMQKN